MGGALFASQTRESTPLTTDSPKKLIFLLTQQKNIQMNCSHLMAKIDHSTVMWYLSFIHHIKFQYALEFQDEPTTPILHLYPSDNTIFYINPQATGRRNYGKTYTKNIGNFVKIMQEFYLQNPDIFDKMVEDYDAIKETVHEKTQQVYHDIIDGVYEQTTPVIK
jgi:hypothetical protein